ncbi:MAG: class I SAM-dependent methyltransferase, partial [Candidatus Aminicenantes bacterium]|nr:class I SAM-dependent methyltransferase [Candidatus Aminicenantes bacterium]
MKPEDLIEFGKISYSKHKAVSAFSNRDLLNDGLNVEETEMIRITGLTTGKVLVMGVGGGREAIALSKLGFRVTGTDFVEEMCQTAKKNCENSGVKLEIHTQEFS